MKGVTPACLMVLTLMTACASRYYHTPPHPDLVVVGSLVAVQNAFLVDAEVQEPLETHYVVHVDRVLAGNESATVILVRYRFPRFTTNEPWPYDAAAQHALPFVLRLTKCENCECAELLTSDFGNLHSTNCRWSFRLAAGVPASDVSHPPCYLLRPDGYDAQTSGVMPNNSVNAPVRPVTALAHDASAAPVRSARYAGR
jgi:hypothetical protein